jgi:hypothetical protein
MAYIGKTPVIGNFQICDAITVVDAQAAYTMQVGGVNVSPESANHMLVSLNGILQAPTSSFTVSGSTITFASALETGDVIDFIQILGNVLDLGVPSDNTVTTAKLSDSSVTTAKLNDASVSLAKLTATGTKDATTFLRGDNTFAGAGITNAQQWRLTTDFTNDANPIASNLEQVDHDGAGKIGSDMTQSSGTFTFPDTGIWYIAFKAAFLSGSGDGANFNFTEILTTINNSSYSSRNNTANASNGGDQYMSAFSTTIFDVTDTSTHKVRFKVNVADSGITTLGNSDITLTGMDFIRLGDT